jgi:hypothetical protein
MRIERSHALGRAEAIQRIDRFVDTLLQRPLPAGVKVSDPQKTWVGSQMNFAVSAAKGFFSSKVGGFVDVSDDRVVLDVNVPAMVTRFVGEDRIRETVERELDRLLS